MAPLRQRPALPGAAWGGQAGLGSCALNLESGPGQSTADPDGRGHSSQGPRPVVPSAIRSPWDPVLPQVPALQPPQGKLHLSSGPAPAVGLSSGNLGC